MTPQPSRPRFRVPHRRSRSPTATAAAGGALALVLAAAAGCGPGADFRAQVQVDTLPGGAVHVQNPRAGLWEAEGRGGWTLEEAVRIGAVEGDGPDLFGQIRGLAADSRGRVHVLDHQAGEVRVFDADGAHLRTLSGPGQGPGELAHAFGLGVDAADRVWAADQGNNRYTVWDAEGRLVGTAVRPFSSWPFIWTAGFDGERLVESGQVIVGPDDRREVLLRISLRERGGQASREAGPEAGQLPGDEGAFARPAADTFPLPPSPLEPLAYSVEGDLGAMYASVPFAPARHVAPASGGRYWMGASDRYRLYLAVLEGDTLRIVERDHDPVPVTRAERDEALQRPFLEQMREQGGEIDPGRVPATKPAFQWLVADDRDHLWVALSNPEGEGGTRLDVFDPEGLYLGQVRTALALQARPSPVIRDGTLWAHVLDELGVSYVVGLRIGEAP